MKPDYKLTVNRRFIESPVSKVYTIVESAFHRLENLNYSNKLRFASHKSYLPKTCHGNSTSGSKAVEPLTSQARG